MAAMESAAVTRGVCMPASLTAVTMGNHNARQQLCRRQPQGPGCLTCDTQAVSGGSPGDREEDPEEEERSLRVDAAQSLRHSQALPLSVVEMNGVRQKPEGTKA